MSDYRLYTAAELGSGGYPPVWHERLKHEVRAAADHRCVRCGHPYRNGEHGNGEWSPCDRHCTHRGPYRYRHGAEDGWFYTPEDEPWIGTPGADENGISAEDVGLEIHARWRILTVHHLDGVKGNCRWWNLTALCQRCHLQIQGRVQMERVWPWEHSDWFKPYVAGYYAWTYLGEDLTREQTVARMDELLGLELAA